MAQKQEDPIRIFSKVLFRFSPQLSSLYPNLKIAQSNLPFPPQRRCARENNYLGGKQPSPFIFTFLPPPPSSKTPNHPSSPWKKHDNPQQQNKNACMEEEEIGAQHAGFSRLFGKW
jgi:hypothetical protein